ncbi:hypothetical protein [Brevibacillus marinus]|uniref:hypothetical protein n=1 Tax=Brevibacillus marinus TaxID=2496837 RepID=UPI000F83143D|nr:hypothetical protein [Brevibacillus marinus]
MYTNYQQASGVQSVFQPGFAGTNPQQVRQDIAQSNFGQAQQAAFGSTQSAQAALGGAQAVFQPGFAGTNPQQVRQDIAQESGFASHAYGGLQPLQQAAYLQPSQAAFGGAQAIFQPGFAGTNPQQIRQQWAQESGYAGSVYAQSPQQAALGGMQSAQAALGGAQAIFQPGFAGTSPQQIRQQWAQESGYAGVYAQSPQAALGGTQSAQAALGGAQAIFQPGFAGTHPQQIRQQWAQESGYAGNVYAQSPQAYRSAQPAVGVQAYQPGFMQ